MEYTYVKDTEAVKGFDKLSEWEGILPALESSHAIAYTLELAPKLKKSEILLVNLSGRGDKDIHTVAQLDGIEI